MQEVHKNKMGLQLNVTHQRLVYADGITYWAKP
jgi:hypothetical protein